MGIRTRLSVRGRAARTLAVLTALTVAAGLAGVLALASWPRSVLPADASAVAMFARADTPPFVVQDEDRRPFGDEPGNSAALMWAFGSTDYGPGYIEIAQDYRGDPRTSGVVLRETVTALARQGWTVDGWPPAAPNEYDCCPGAHLHRGGLLLDLTAEGGGYLDSDPSPDQPSADFQISYDLTEATPTAIVPWTVAGLVAGAAVGWLAAAWLVRRVRAVHGTLALFGIAVGLLAPAALVSLTVAVVSVIRPVGMTATPPWAGYTAFGIRPLAWLGLTLLVIASAEIVWRQHAAR